MAKVQLEMSMSLDGYIAGPDVSVEHPLGKGGERLHDWMFNRDSDNDGAPLSTPIAEANQKLSAETFSGVGAVVLGKRTFEAGLPQWGDTPYPVPSFALTHEVRANLPQKSAEFTFVNDGIESAVRQAKAAAGDKNVMLMGADIAQQALKAGLVDEIQLNIVPVLLCEGVRLFDHIGTTRVELEPVRVVETPVVTHIKYRVRK